MNNKNNKYRVNWQAGMRLTDATFRAADEFHIQQAQPLLAMMVRESYGFLESPIVRFELTEDTISFIELQANAITYSGKLIQLAFNREERPLFQCIPLPDVNEAVIIFIDKTSDDVVPLVNVPGEVPLCDADYKILVKLESDHYDNPDAIPLARFVLNHGWQIDTSFIAPCIMLRANGALYNQAANYLKELNSLINALKEAKNSAQGVLVKTVVPWLTAVSVEIEKESDSMSPRHFISLIQQVIQALLAAADMEDDIEVPLAKECKEFVESHYTPYSTAYLVSEGIRLTHALIELPSSFETVVPQIPPTPATEAPAPRHIVRGEGSRGRIDRRTNT